MSGMFWIELCVRVCVCFYDDSGERFLKYLSFIKVFFEVSHVHVYP